MKKDITIVISSLEGGGAERVAVTIANTLQEMTFRIDFVVLNLIKSVRHHELSAGIRLINLNVKHARGSFSAFRKYLQDNQPSRILVFNHEIAVVLIILRNILKLNFYIVARNINPLTELKKHATSFWHKYIKDVLIRFFYPRVDCIIAQSEAMKKDLTENYSMNPDQIVTIHNPVSEAIKINGTTTHSKRTKKNELLFIGRLEEQKGIFYLLDAFKLVLKKNPDTKLRIIGEGSLQNELSLHSIKLGISDHVIFESYKDDIGYDFIRSKVTVLSSIYEGFPNVLVESVFYGTPVVSFDCKTGPSEIIKNGVNGFLAEYLNVKDLADKICVALTYNWDVKKIMASADKFRTEKVIHKYIECLQLGEDT